MCARPRVMLDVIAIIEEQKVIQLAVVTDRPTRVLVVPLQIAKTDAYQEAWHINGSQELRSAEQQKRPQQAYGGQVQRRHFQVTSVRGPVMCEMPRTPERLREAEQQTEIARERYVQCARF